jgi:formylglycine-generating enzyme required for sulfatase activity
MQGPAAGRLLAVLALGLALAACANIVSIDDLMDLVNANVAPDISVSAGGSALASGSGQYDFGTIIDDGAGLYCASEEVTFTVTNSGGASTTLNVTGVSLSDGDTGEFVLAGGEAASLAHGESLTFTIRFDPTQEGSLSATVTIASSDPDEAAFHFTVLGTGQAFSIATVAVTGASSVPIGHSTTLGPLHTVTSVSNFYIGKYEVTYDEWMIVKTWGEANGYLFANTGDMGKDGGGTAQHPVTKMSWRDAIAWCNAASEFQSRTPAYYNHDATHDPANYYKNSSTGGDIDSDDVNWTTSNGYRLPTEVEWEYGARFLTATPTQTAGNWPSGGTGASAATTIEAALYAYFSTTSTHPVGELQQNALLAYDMSGNVQELCWDWFGGSNSTTWYAEWTNADPRGPTTGTYRVARGGSWYQGLSRTYTSDHNAVMGPTDALNYTGFRVAKSIE